MYLQLKNITLTTITRGGGKSFPALKIGLCGLYKEDGKNIKFLEMNDIIIQKLLQSKIEITLPEIQSMLKEAEIQKLIPPPPPGFFANIPLKGFEK